MLSKDGRLWGLHEISLDTVSDGEVRALGQSEPLRERRERVKSSNVLIGSFLRYAMIMESFLAIASSATALVRSTVRRAELFR